MLIGQKNYVGVDFKITHPIFFQSDDNNIFLTNQRVYTSYRIVVHCNPTLILTSDPNSDQ